MSLAKVSFKSALRAAFVTGLSASERGGHLPRRCARQKDSPEFR